ncbi:MAG: hypothetical protein Q7T21_15485 [Gallionella sp.]|nr:hypothetical protein [Gallionella sp.]
MTIGKRHPHVFTSKNIMIHPSSIISPLEKLEKIDLLTIHHDDPNIGVNIVIAPHCVLGYFTLVVSSSR